MSAGQRSSAAATCGAETLAEAAPSRCKRLPALASASAAQPLEAAATHPNPPAVKGRLAPASFSTPVLMLVARNPDRSSSWQPWNGKVTAELPGTSHPPPSGHLQGRVVGADGEQGVRVEVSQSCREQRWWQQRVPALLHRHLRPASAVPSRRNAAQRTTGRRCRLGRRGRKRSTS